MKNIRLLNCFLTTILLWGSTFAAFAQNDPKAISILDKVKEKYQAMKAFTADFTFNLTNKTGGVNETYNGKIYVKGDRYHLILPEQEVITDGKTQWTYLKDSKEVNITEYEPEANEITPNRIYTVYESDYLAAFIEDEVENGKAYEIIELKPKNLNSPFFKIRLKIVKDTKSIKSWEIFEKNNSRYLYTVKHFATVKVGDTYFRFDPTKYPKDIEVVDLR
ncbi:MAG: outer membrane lipoprotein carrier protein LolA [Microscillaceae bacterium]|nr:outer membrane lipoprotein carrier protein LolA [Microscillaceae bacterium]